MEILTASGEVILCRPDNAYSELFFGFANSYGTLGYALRLRIELVPAGPYVHLSHQRYATPEAYFEALALTCREARARGGRASFVDGVVFREGEMYRSIGRSCEAPEAVSNYRFMRPYYRSIREREEDCLSIQDYIWRWDTDWFWCARAFGMENPLIRFPFGLFGGLNSRTYCILILASGAACRKARNRTAITVWSKRPSKSWGARNHFTPPRISASPSSGPSIINRPIRP